ncbi:hypothetical protein MTR_5g035250 [Medicago truncatula]|uniref:Uncharacterized protein n=1 Tax=Medicago truncatula TaxID=3880 RepID=G7K2V2_MEDTR|nr:hypothetical protein MTR_5g035250 [Medicago truncatula]
MVFHFPMLSNNIYTIDKNSRITQRNIYSCKVRMDNTARVPGVEAFSDYPKLYRNASSSSNISSFTLQSSSTNFD